MEWNKGFRSGKQLEESNQRAWRWFNFTLPWAAVTQISGGTCAMNSRLTVDAQLI